MRLPAHPTGCDWERALKTLGLIETRARLSAIVARAEKGEPTLVTKHGREAAMIVPIEAGLRLYPKPSQQLSFAELLSPPTRRRARTPKSDP
jgi:prevent-host-death family protein